MKITQKQLMQLYQIAMAGLNIVNPMAFDQEERRKLVNDILNQQDNETLITVNPELPHAK